jgi:hypothetical protein
MATRRAGTASSLNFFPTPPWAARALMCEVLRPRFDAGGNAWEPACGAGHCAIAIAPAFHQVFSSDVFDWGFGDARNLDFSLCGPEQAPLPVDWVITNPPFVLADTFVRRGLAIARQGVALLMRLSWQEGGKRYYDFFAPHAPMRCSMICPFAERVPMIEGAYDPEASSATAYAWFIWHKPSMAAEFAGHGDIPTVHFPPVMQDRYWQPYDELMASRGEAQRRRKARADA